MLFRSLANDVAATQKENAVLKSKMKVLVDKIEEYRANEEALNMAILSAQKLAVQIENEARQRASAMLAEADEQVKAKVGSIQEATAIEERRLADAKAATAKFFDSMRVLCNKQLQNLEAIANEVVPQEEVPAEDAVADTVRSIENNVAKAQPDPTFDIDVTPAEEPAEDLFSFDSTQPFTV